MLVYRLILTLVAPVLLLVQGWRRGDWGRSLSESLGFGTAPPQGPTLWLHGASNGELTSARWLVERLIAERPGLRILVTCNTATARQMVTQWGHSQVDAAYAPIDGWGATGRLADRWRPSALITLEAEVWPARLAACTARHIPIVLLGARMSERSFGRWRRVANLSRAALSQVAFASAQDQSSRDRLVQLGLPETALSANFDLKAEAARDTAPVWATRTSRAQWLLAASTHDGEDAAVLDAYLAARASGRFSHLIIAPRHTNRATAIAALLKARGLAFALRSAGAGPDDAEVLLADTMGEMDRWYAQCGACIIGGTFAPKDGHSPWEPARHGCAILHGPFTANFATAFANLDAAEAALAVSTTDDLAEALKTLDPNRQDQFADTAARVLVATNDPNGLINQLFRVTGL